MSLQPEINTAVDEIINETMSLDEKDIVEINLDNLENMSPKLKDIIRGEFDNCLNILDFRNHAYEIYRRWYVDGRLYYHVIIDEKHPEMGIQEIRYIDPRKIRKVREVAKRTVPGGADFGQTNIPTIQNEYFIFNDRGFNYGNRVIGPSTTGLKIAKDTILHVTSGLTDTQGAMVLGYLHQAIKAMNQLRTLEDAVVIYRLSRAPERRIWYIDVGNLPKMKAEQYVREIMVKHKNRLIYDSESGQIRDDRKFQCVSVNTKIPLLDGRTLTLEEIISEYKAGKKNWVYSADPITGKFAPGPVSWAGVTIKNSPVVRVTLDNGESVVCTPDHKFPVWNKGFIEAQNLAIGESIIPGYRRKEPIAPGQKDYEQIYCNVEKKWKFTHREVAKWKDEVGLREEFIWADPAERKGVIHHKDVNRFNNSPENLVMMGWVDHFKYHSVFCNSEELRKKNAEDRTLLYTPEIYELVEQVARLQLRGPETAEFINQRINKIEWMELNIDKVLPQRSEIPWKFLLRDLGNACKKLGYKNWTDYSSQFALEIIPEIKVKHVFDSNSKGAIAQREYRQRTKPNITSRGSDEWRERLSNAAKNRKSTSSTKTWKITKPDGEQEIIENLSAYCRANNLNKNNIKYDFGSKGYHAEQLKNHKVVSVEWLDHKEDVGCLTVDLNETYHSNHTFLLDCGILTKNTMLEDYWLPRREGGRGTEVTTLPGGQNLGQMEDVLYFQKKLYQTLYVPVNRLNSDALFSMGRATEVTRDEIKFSRFISRLRYRFSQLFTKMLEKQLSLKQIMTVEEFSMVGPELVYDFSRDNYFTELKDTEMAMSRMNAARQAQDMVGKYYSQSWLRKSILNQSDDDIEQMDKEINDEFNSADVRWQNPISLQQTMLQPPEPTEGPEPGSDEFEQQVDEHNKLKRIQEAKANYDLLKKKKHRSLSDQALLHSTAQILSKNGMMK